jgi:hypothetical protein
MKRYTILFQPSGQVSKESLKSAVEDALQRLHPRIVCRIGGAARRDSGSIAVEILSEGKKETLEPDLQAVEKKLPVLESIGWGWDPHGLPADSSPIINPDLRPDPLAEVAPSPLPVVFTPDIRKRRLRYALFAALTAALILAFIARLVFEESIIATSLCFGIYIVWLFSTTELPIDIRPLADRVECREDGLAVTFWLGKKTARLDWRDMLGLDWSSASCTVFGGKDRLRFLSGKRGGFAEQERMRKTIVRQAELRFAEGGAFRAAYRRYDAP